MLWAKALGGLQHDLFEHLARRPVEVSLLNLVMSDQAAIKRLPQCLADEPLLHCACPNQVKDRPQRASEPEALRALYVGFGQICVVKNEDARDLTVSPEVHWNRHMELGRVQIRQIVKAKCRLVA